MIMIHDVDEALRELIRVEALRNTDVDVSLHAPTGEWSSGLDAPTVNMYLYDIREDSRRRQRGMINEYDDDGVVAARHIPPRYVRLSYLITAWAVRPGDEHRLLSSLLAALFQYEALPASVLPPGLASTGLPFPMTVALPPSDDRAPVDIWRALGCQLRPSIDVVVSAPVDGGRRVVPGRPPDEGLRLLVGGEEPLAHRGQPDQRGPDRGPTQDPPAPQVALARRAC